HHEQRGRREEDIEIARAHEAVEVDEEIAGEAGEEPRQDEGDVFVAPHVEAEHLHAPLALPDADEGASEGRAHDQRERADRQSEKHQHEVVEGDAAGQRPRQRQIGPRDAREPIVAARERAPPEGDAPQDLAERKRDHQEVASAGPEREESEERAHAGRHQEPRREIEPEVVGDPKRQETDRVRGDTEISGVAERRQPGVAQEEIEAHREDAEDEHLGDQAQLIRGQDGGQRDKNRERRRSARDARLHRAPNRPVGRMARMTAIGANTVNRASSGKSALPKLSSRPTTRPPTKAPLRLPSPPMMTTTSAISRISKSAPGKTPTSGPPMMPPSPARKAPSANTAVERSPTFPPAPRAIMPSHPPAR